MDAAKLKEAGIPIAGADAVSLLRAEAALDWMHEHTTLNFDKEDMESVKALPSCAKLFVVKFCEAFKQREGVASQSIEGLSQSFATTDKSTLIWQLANTLLGDHMQSGIRVHTAKRRW